MVNFELLPDEVVQYEGTVSTSVHKGKMMITLTSQKLVFEQEKGLFKKRRELVEIITFDKIKIHDDVAQIQHKRENVEIQTITGNYTLTFDESLEAGTFTSKMISAVTGTTPVQRGRERIRKLIDVVDSKLGVDTREAIKGALKDGVKSAIRHGMNRKK